MAGKFAIITPYYNESPALLRRCIESVVRQTVPVEHLLIADGVPQSWLDTEPVRHIKLDKSHGDYGNTPRGIGSLLAISEGFDGFGFLDADNWLEPKHVQLCAQFGTGFDYVIAQRHFRRPDETIMLVQDGTSHVDTNCLFLLKGAFLVAPFFSMMPKELSAIGDRVFTRALQERGLKVASVPVKTVNYHCMWEGCYRALGEPPPPGAKPNVDGAAIEKYLHSLSDREFRLVSNLSGVHFSRRTAAPPKRNAPCECGSGLKYKHCHGKLAAM
jgi:cellulose synthase/poly-beta-1,6-N-acetylglucosamine synthase-like glycosyltransferase